MATETLNPTASTTPAVDYPGDDAWSTGSNSGNDTIGSYCFSCSSPTVEHSSAEWHTWESPVYQADYTALSLKVGWTMAALSAYHCCQVAKLYLEYSYDDGGTWSDFSGFPKNFTTSPQNGTANKDLAVGRDLSLLRVRARLEAGHDGSCDCDFGSCSCETTATTASIRTVGVYSTGACCSAVGNCSIKSASTCGGSYQGDGTDCSPNPCPQPVQQVRFLIFI